jgi:mono/diheme cytochrome c family protein
MNSERSSTYYRMKALLVALLLVITTAPTWAAANPDNGKTIFKANCARCHYITEQKMVGPGLKGVMGRWGGDEGKLHAWIKNSQEYLKTGDKYANELFKAFGGSIMPSFNLKDEEISDILAYIEKGDGPEDGGGGTETAGTPGAANDGKGKGGNKNVIIIILVIAAIVLLVVARALSNVSRSMENISRKESGDDLHPERTPFDFFTNAWNWFATHKKFSLLIGIIVMSWLSYEAWKGLNTLGVYQGYKPEQPIKFSHVTHVKQNGIDCKYCHATVEKSRHAGIPSSNVCMNCHKAVNNGPKTKKVEISKIYAAIGWNPVDLKYWDNYQNADKDKIQDVFKEWLKDEPGSYDAMKNQIQQPVQWVQVHYLPEHVYFSHQQHIVVGKLECKECHGDVQEMETVEQFAPLTMGWCINCHRKTDVQFASNGYYDRLHNYYKEHYGEYEMTKGQAFTVEKIGGLECSKCHY